MVEIPHPRPKPGERRIANFESGLGPLPPICDRDAALPWCLRCKTFSHVVRDCPILRPEQDDLYTSDPITSIPSLDEFLFSMQQEFDRDSRDIVCKRCLDLDIGSLFRLPPPPQHAAAGHPPSAYGRALDVVVKKLGNVRDLELLSNCPVCKLFVASVQRLDPGGWKDLQVLRVSDPFLSTINVPDRDDAVNGLLRKLDLVNLPRRLFLTTSGSRISVHPLGIRTGIALLSRDDDTLSDGRVCVGPRPNWDIIKMWLDSCETSHGACGLQANNAVLATIRVVDVSQRMVVPYNYQGCSEYVALSYVWGGSKQAAVALNTPLEAVPQSVEDAMEVTRKLGKRYLWVDGLCINQSDEEYKRSQIMIMDRIYQHAWATIINLSGTSAESSIPRVSGNFRIRQVQYSAGNDQYVCTPPALAAYVRQSPWSSRAWVLQEALLSRRRLFFTHSQVYFECDSRQDSEFETLQRLYLPVLQQRACSTAEEFTTRLFALDFAALDAGGTINRQSLRVIMYTSLLKDYRNRHMSFSSDSLNAFAAIATTLSSGFNTPVIYGMPTVDFPYVLGWRQTIPAKQLPEFPSWSWTAWEGELTTAAASPYEYRDWQLADDGRPFFEPFFKLHGFDCERNLEDHDSHRQPWEDAADDVPILKIKNLAFVDAVRDLDKTDLMASQNLVVEGIVLTLFVNGAIKVPSPKAKYPVAKIEVFLGSARCELTATSAAHAEVFRQTVGGDPVEALILHRGELLSSIRYDLLLLEWRDGIAYRLDSISLQVPGKELRQLINAKPIHKRFVLG